MPDRRKARDSRDTAHMRQELLDWYDHNKRDLPWRQTQDPYAIWVSEIMLQQTRVAAVLEKYRAFLERFPTLQALAKAREQDVLALWSGLGYYRRARMLHKAAQAVVAERDGRMPQTAAELRELPGIGPYTAAAVASIAHGEAIAVVDGNVERVLSRIREWESHDTAGEAAVRRKVEQFAATLVDPRRPGDFNQAIMELGATVCMPRNPECLRCPWARDCRTLGEHKTPKRAPMTTREMMCALAFRKGKAGNFVLLEQRPATNTVMPGLWELPPCTDAGLLGIEPVMTVRHAIMQVNYVVRVYELATEALNPGKRDRSRRWVPLENAGAMALTGLARKVLTRAGLLRESHRNSHIGFAITESSEVP